MQHQFTKLQSIAIGVQALPLSRGEEGSEGNPPMLKYKVVLV